VGVEMKQEGGQRNSLYVFSDLDTWNRIALTDKIWWFYRPCLVTRIFQQSSSILKILCSRHKETSVFRIQKCSALTILRVLIFRVSILICFPLAVFLCGWLYMIMWC